KSSAVHSQTLPIICRHPNTLSLAGRAPTGMHPIARQSRFARSAVAGSSPHGTLGFVLSAPETATGSRAGREPALSHSATVGSLRGALLQNAFASYQLA